MNSSDDKGKKPKRKKRRRRSKKPLSSLEERVPKPVPFVDNSSRWSNMFNGCGYPLYLVAFYLVVTNLSECSPQQTTQVNNSEQVDLEIFTTSSDGFTWRRASLEQKRALCKAMERSSLKGKSATFFYDALESFYSSTDPSVMRTRIGDTVALMEGASGH
jgi:hypothetical protein